MNQELSLEQSRRSVARVARRGGEPFAQFARFLVVGVGNTAISYAVYRVSLALGVWYPAASVVGFAAGAVNGYVFNRTWTFRSPDCARARLRYVAVQVAGALATSLLVAAFVALAIRKSEAYLAAVPPVTVCMFVANRLWTFADRTSPALVDGLA